MGSRTKVAQRALSHTAARGGHADSLSYVVMLRFVPSASSGAGRGASCPHLEMSKWAPACGIAVSN